MKADPEHQSPDDDEIKHVYDGIEEYDKKLPNWWLMTFYLGIVFSIAYWFYFHIAEAGNTPEQKLALAQARAAAFAAEGGGGDFSEDTLLAMSRDEAVVTAARNAYATSCAACHGAELEGGIGPNLKDDEWIHGGLPGQILATIQQGVPAKGMPGWKAVLGEKRTAELTALILSLNPATDPGADQEAAGGGG